MKAAALLLILPCAVYACQGGAPSSSDSTTLTADRLGLQTKERRRPAATVTAGAPSSPRGYFGDATSPSPPEAEFSAASADHGASQASTADDALQNVNAATTAAPTMVIRIGQAFIEVDKVDPAILKIRQLATQVGGYITNSSVSGGRDKIRKATLVLTFRAPRYHRAAGS